MWVSKTGTSHGPSGWVVTMPQSIVELGLFIFQFPDEPILEWKGSSLAPMSRFISYLTARNMISKGYIYHLVRVKDSTLETPSLESAPVVCEFP